MSSIDSVAVLGAGTMGHGIAQVCAAAGCEVRLYDIDDAAVGSGLERIGRNLDKGIERGKVTEDEREDILARLSTTTTIVEAVSGVDLVIEAAPESMELKEGIFSAVAATAPAIAAASVAATVYRDRLRGERDERYPGYVLASHKGYASAEHLAAVGSLGPSPAHRRRFSPFKPALFDRYALRA